MGTSIGVTKLVVIIASWIARFYSPRLTRVCMLRCKPWLACVESTPIGQKVPPWLVTLGSDLAALLLLQNDPSRVIGELFRIPPLLHIL